MPPAGFAEDRRGRPLTRQTPPDDAPHLLVIDDDTRIRELLARYLSDQGYRVSTAADAREARRWLVSIEFDLLIVDVMMPGETGLSFVRSLRNDSAVPVLMLTAMAEAGDRIDGLEAGADDYVSKPFEPRELVLRINSILRRVGRPAQGEGGDDVVFGPYQFSPKRRELRRGRDVIRLTEREQDMLCTFALAPDGTLARQDLLGEEDSQGERKIDVQINRLRRKLEDDPADPKFLLTVRGVGYRLCLD